MSLVPSVHLLIFLSLGRLYAAGEAGTIHTSLTALSWLVHSESWAPYLKLTPCKSRILQLSKTKKKPEGNKKKEKKSIIGYTARQLKEH